VSNKKGGNFSPLDFGAFEQVVYPYPSDFSSQVIKHDRHIRRAGLTLSAPRVYSEKHPVIQMNHR
jgi:hypothetical protein